MIQIKIYGFLSAFMDDECVYRYGRMIRSLCTNIMQARIGNVLVTCSVINASFREVQW
jgi:hypothetical protein